ncbi:MAG: hypothetical protein V2A54_01680 [Bacteroidota bacterium]
MKKVLSIAAMSLVLFLAFQSCGKKSSLTPIQYNDSIVGIQGKIIKAILDLSATFEGRNAAEMDASYSKLKTIIDDAITNVSKMEEYDGSTELRDAAKELFEFYKSVVGKEYGEMITILKKKDTDVTEADIKRIDEISADISKREKALDEKFAKAQEKFAKDNNIQIKENELQKDINKL